MQCRVPAILKNARYHNITISGLPGCGSTTMLNGLRDTLAASGWRGFSGGEFMRHYATEKGLWDANNNAHHNATVYSVEFENEVDFGMRDKLQNETQWIIESWLSGFLAQGVPKTLKILMTCSSDDIRIDRVVNRDNITIEQAKQNTIERYEANLRKWTDMYGDKWQEWVVDAGKAKPEDPIDFWRPDLYDLVLDTYSMNQEQTLRTVLNELAKKETA
ncbi:AAA family ATPase [bacterium]|nr:AAA family ATPase [bacterium]MBQ6436725.1 AAA family ATPase [bacterium]